jgi:hypothetical protein
MFFRIRNALKHRMLPFIDQVSFASAAYHESKNHVINRSRDLIDFSKAPETSADMTLVQFLKGLSTKRINGLDLVRIGGNNDGGYVMYRPNQSSIALSLGVGPNVSWDKEMVSLGHKVYMFDPTIKRPPMKVPGARFHRIGVEGNNDSYPNLDLRPLKNLREDLTEVSNSYVLKIDVEGAEWQAFANADPGELENYEQIAVEFHDLHKLKHPTNSGIMLRAIENILLTHDSVHIHANNYSKLIRFGQYWFPDVIEVSFVRKNNEFVATSAESVASDFDQPNCEFLDDYNLEGLIKLWINQ